MRSASLFLLCSAMIGMAACRPSSDRVAATESGAAASGGSAGTRQSGDPVAKGAEKATPETLPTNLVVADAGDATNAASTSNQTASRPSAAAPTIPAQYRGRWGMVPADCDPGRGDAKGLIRVGERTIRFYESTATLKEQSPAIATVFSGEFSFTGEGMSWTKTMTLSVEGDALTRTEGDQSFVYSRCG